MKKRKNTAGHEFSTFHPLVSFLYFVLMIGCGMIFLHPMILILSLIASFLYSVHLNGKRAIGFNLLYLLPTLAVMTLINPLFNHEGVTILGYFRTGNPLTLESIYYGLASGAMLVSVVCWFSCFNCVITSEKLIYLFGRIIPSLSLILSMAMRFVPRFKEQIRHIADAQRAIGKDISEGSVLMRCKNAMTVLSAMVSWALENSIETANSMKSRGYGLKGRSSFSIYTMDRRDIIALLYLGIAFGYILAGAIIGGLYYRYFPSFRLERSWYTMSIGAVYLLTALFPMLYDLVMRQRWAKIDKGEKFAATDQFGAR